MPHIYSLINRANIKKLQYFQNKCVGIIQNYIKTTNMESELDMKYILEYIYLFFKYNYIYPCII